MYAGANRRRLDSDAVYRQAKQPVPKTLTINTRTQLHIDPSGFVSGPVIRIFVRIGELG
jgi:hypothetical protein